VITHQASSSGLIDRLNNPRDFGLGRLRTKGGQVCDVPKRKKVEAGTTRPEQLVLVPDAAAGFFGAPACQEPWNK
jgi:hypothetical protein